MLQVKISLDTIYGAISANFIETPPPKLHPMGMHLFMPFNWQNYLRS